jgi:hypothetical protein
VWSKTHILLRNGAYKRQMLETWEGDETANNYFEIMVDDEKAMWC